MLAMMPIGYFMDQVEPVRGQVGIGKHHPNDGRKRVRLELDRREIDGDGDLRGPVGGLGAGGPKNPLADRNDEARVFGEGDEVGDGAFRRGDGSGQCSVPLRLRGAEAAAAVTNPS